MLSIKQNLTFEWSLPVYICSWGQNRC